MNDTPVTTEPGSSRKERVVGAFMIVALLMLVAGFGYYLYQTSERRGWRVPQCPFYTYVQSAEGLEVGNRVKMMGFEIGEITVIEAQPVYSYYNVFVGVAIKKPYYGYIWTDSKIKVANTGLLGRQLEITKGLTGTPTVNDKNNRPAEVWFDGKFIPLAQAPKGVFLNPDESASVTERAEKLLAQVEAALPNILAITNRLNTVLDNTSGLMTNSTALVANLNQTTAQLPTVLSNVTAITGNLRDPHGSLGDWVIPADIHTNLNTSIANLTISLNETLLNLAAITGNLNSQVQSNDQILASISKLVIDTDTMVQGLKKHWLLRSAFAKPTGTNAPPVQKKSR